MKKLIGDNKIQRPIESTFSVIFSTTCFDLMLIASKNIEESDL